MSTMPTNPGPFIYSAEFELCCSETHYIDNINVFIYLLKVWKMYNQNCFQMWFIKTKADDGPPIGWLLEQDAERPKTEWNPTPVRKPGASKGADQPVWAQQVQRNPRPA